MSSSFRRLVQGAFYLSASSFGGTGVQLLSQMILARLLVPSDFGMVAVVLSIQAVLGVFAEMGISSALIQVKEINQKKIDTAIVANFALTAFTALVIYILSPVASDLLKSANAELLQWMAAGYFFVGLFSVQKSLLFRSFRYKMIGALELLSGVTFGIVACVLALSDVGAKSILIGYAVGHATSFGVALFLTHAFPKSLGSWVELKKLLAFGFWVSFGRMLGSASTEFDKILLNWLVPPNLLGGYYLSQRIGITMISRLTAILDKVAFPIYSRMQDNREEVESSYLKTIQASAIIILPFSMFTFLTAEYSVPLIFGDQWLFAVPILRILSLYGVVQALGGGVFSAVVLAFGRPHINVIINVIRFLLLPPCLWMGSYYGIEGVAWGIVGYALLGRVINQSILSFSFNFKVNRYFRSIGLPILISSSSLVMLEVLKLIILEGMGLSLVTEFLILGLSALVLQYAFLKKAYPMHVSQLISKVRRVLRSTK